MGENMGHGSYETGCANKDKHRTKVDADNQATKRRTSGALRGIKKLHPYHCEFCGFWHVGGDNRARRKPYKRHKTRRQW